MQRMLKSMPILPTRQTCVIVTPMNPPVRLRTRHVILAAAGALVLLGLLLTYPLPLHWTTHAPGDGSDDPAIIWNLWWVRHALLNLGRNPFATDYLFFPIGINLTFYTLTLLNALITLPVQLFAGLIPANSAVVYLELTLAGLGMYLLALDLLPASVPVATRHRGSFLAAVIFAFAGHKFVFLSLGQFNIASTHWLPFYVLYLRRALRPPFRRRDAGIAALFLLFNAWTEFTYASFALIFTAFYATFRLVSRRTERPLTTAWRPLLRALLWIAVPFTLGMTPILAMMIPDLLREGDFTVVGLGFADVFSNDLLEFFVPGHLHPLWGTLVQHFHFAYLNFAYLGYVAAGMAAYALWKWRAEREVRFWAVAAAAFAVISFGPTIRLNGSSYDFPLPFDLLLRLPFFKANRYPGRYSVMIALCLALLAAYGLAALESSPRFARSSPSRMALFAALGALIVLENLSVPLPLSNYHVPAVYDRIAADPGDFSVLEIPLAWRNGFRVTGPLDKAFMFAQFYQTTHGKHLLGGNTSRNPGFKFQYFTEAPVINSLLALETGHDVPQEIIDRDRRQAADVLRFFRVRYIVVHKLASSSRRVTPEATLPYIEQLLPGTEWYEDARMAVFRLDPQDAPPSGRVAATDPLADLMLAEGWGPAASPEQAARWATRKEARLLLPLGTKAYTLTLDLDVPAAGQIVSVIVNGREIARQTLPAGRSPHHFAIPADPARQAPADVRLRFDRLYPPPAANGSGWPIGTTGSFATAPVLVESAGEEVGNLAHIYVAGHDVITAQRGFNLAVIAPQTMGVVSRATFDTHLDPAASRRLADFIAGIPRGQIVAVAVADEASRLLGNEAVGALRSLGLRQDLQGKAHFRWSYAALGVKGAPSGSAWEAASGIRPVRVGVGPAIREGSVAVGLTGMIWEENHGP